MTPIPGPLRAAHLERLHQRGGEETGLDCLRNRFHRSLLRRGRLGEEGGDGVFRGGCVAEAGEVGAAARAEELALLET